MRKNWKVFVVFTVMATVLAIPGVALAHHTAITAETDCVNPDVTWDFTYSVTAATGTTPPATFSELHNDGVEVRLLWDGVEPGIVDQTTPFTADNNNSFDGAATAPAGTASVIIRAIPGAWNDPDYTGPNTADIGEFELEAPTEPCFEEIEGRMTGGGSFFDGSGRDKVRYTHGFELHCDYMDLPNNLEINWPGLRFHLTELTAAVCTDDSSIAPHPPAAPFDTYHGWGIGRLNGVDGALIEFIFTDTGQPGRSDTADVTITWPDGSTAVANYLTFGNHQAHRETGR